MDRTTSQRSNAELSRTAAPGDFKKDGDVDFGVFVSLFHDFPPPAVSAPEPATGYLAVAAFGCCFGKRRG